MQRYFFHFAKGNIWVPLLRLLFLGLTVAFAIMFWTNLNKRRPLGNEEMEESLQEENIITTDYETLHHSLIDKSKELKRKALRRSRELEVFD